jgi:hypothetical protein
MSIGKLFFPRKLHQFLETSGPETAGIIQFIFGRQHLNFVSQYNPKEAAQRLKQNTVEAPFFFCWWWQEDALIGTVTEEKVRLLWVMGQTRNSFNPIFTGRFKSTNGGSILEGSYSIHWFVKIFLCLWFGGLAAGVSIATIVVLKGHGFKVFSSAHGIGLLIFLVFAGLMAAGGIGLVAFGKRISAESLKAVTERIETSLGYKEMA